MLDVQLDYIRGLQEFIGVAWKPFFEAITFLGDEQFYLLALPLLFWSINYRLGARIAFLYILSSAINTGLKGLFMQPRPGELDPALQLAESPGGGLPSGHAQTAMVVWGYLAGRIRRSWAWVAATVLVFLIGVSRVFLGVHFPTDVLAGWVIGALLLVGFLRATAALERSIAQLKLAYQLALAIGLPVLLVSFRPIDEVVAAMGAICGLSVGIALSGRYLGYDAAGSIAQRAARYVLGAVTVLAIYLGLRGVFPAEGASLYVGFRFLRYVLTGFWVAYAAPWVFIRIGLAGGGVSPAPDFH